MIMIAVGAMVLSGCVVPRTEPEPATIRQSPPPWDAPRDAISWIELAQLEPERLDTTTNQRIVELRVEVAGSPVEVPAFVGIDRVRALQASAHTHDTSGQVWLEGREARLVTIGQFFVLWGVRLDADCLGSVCGGTTIEVERDGTVSRVGPELALAQAQTITVRVG